MNSAIHVMKTPFSALVPILHSQTQGEILAILFSNPEQEFTLSSLTSRVERSQATVWREVDKAEVAGHVQTRKVGNVILVRIHESNRFFRPMREIIIGAFGPPAIIEESLAKIEKIHAIILFGSWVARYQGKPGKSPNDIDVLVIGQPDRKKIYAAAERAEEKLALPVQVTVRSPKEWASPDPFLREVKSHPLVVLYTDESVAGLRDS